MLISYSISNYKSLKTEQTLSMLPVTSMKEYADNNISLTKLNEKSMTKVLNSAVVYGPNGSGKSSFIESLQCLRRFVLTSSKMNPSDSIPELIPFQFTEEVSPTSFDLMFIVDHVRYQYKLSTTKHYVVSEELYSFPKKKLFSRMRDSNGNYDYTVNRTHVAGKSTADVWAEMTRDNGLLLSTAIQLNNKTLKPVFDWFKHTLHTSMNLLSSFNETSEACFESDSLKERVLTLLDKADTGITNISITKEEIVEEEFFSQLKDAPIRDEMKTVIRDAFMEDEDKTYLDTKMKHGYNIPNSMLDLSEESDGTKKLYSLSVPLIKALDEGQVVVIDELGENLHPLLVKRIIELFHSPEINKNGAQLIFSSHDPMLKDYASLRRDQVWFTEKNQEHATELFALSDFSVRFSKNFSKAYLLGEFDAIPHINSKILIEQ